MIELRILCILLLGALAGLSGHHVSSLAFGIAACCFAIGTALRGTANDR